MRVAQCLSMRHLLIAMGHKMRSMDGAPTFIWAGKCPALDWLQIAMPAER
jgi:hypothetical protein